MIAITVLLSYTFEKLLSSCHSIDASRYEECAGVLDSNDHIDTEYNMTSSNSKRTLNYLAMAFRSVSLNMHII